MIRQATVADLDAVVTMGRHFRSSLNYTNVIAENVPQMYATATALIERDDQILLVAESDAALVGMLGGLLFDHFISGERTAAEMFWWVEPRHRFGVHGIKLLKIFERWASRHGASMVQMIAPSIEVGAIYERLGYAAVEVGWQKRLQPMRKVA